MDILKDLIGDRSSSLISALTGSAGFSKEQAEAFVPTAVDSVMDTLKGGSDVDLSDPAAATRDIVNKIDVGSLASKVGIDAGKASSGLSAMLPTLLQLVQDKVGDLGALGSLLSGKQGGLGGMLGGVGKLFGK